VSNPFTDESRDSRIKISVAGLCDTLRAPESLHHMVMIEKPATVSAGDFALKSMLDSVLMTRMVRGDYRGIQRLLGTLFGPLVPDGTVAPTPAAERHKGGR
jgi:hypothetical protein